MWRKAKDDMGNADNRNGVDRANSQNQGSNLDVAVNALIAAILECEEYLTYRAELDKVLQVPELKTRIDEYRRRSFELQSSTDIDFDKLDRFEKEFEDFRSASLVSDFLEAELAFCRRMQEIETSVTAKLDFQ